MPTVQYLRVSNCENGTAKKNEDSRKGYRSIKWKLTKDFLYTNHLKQYAKMVNNPSSDDIFGLILKEYI